MKTETPITAATVATTGALATDIGVARAAANAASAKALSLGQNSISEQLDHVVDALTALVDLVNLS